MMTLQSAGASTQCASTPFLLMLLCVLFLISGCAADRLTVSPADTAWQPWQVIETRTGRQIPFVEWMKDLEHHDIIYLGEEHQNPYHIEAALKILNQLVADGIEPTIGMEMFGWDGQPALDRYVSTTDLSTNEFLEQVRWKQNWGGAFEDYAPLVTFARESHVALRAMNPPRPFIRRIVKVGLDQAKQEPEWATSGMNGEEIVDDPAYRSKILDQLQRCHGGTEEHYRTMFEASMVRDEGMAKTLALRQEELRRDQHGPRQIIVSYTGGGHIQYNLPVPKRVARRLADDVQQTTIYMVSYDKGKTDDVRTFMQDSIADYIWLTPMGKPPSTGHCR